VIAVYRLFIGAVAVIMFIALYVLLARTRIGIVVRAAEHVIPDRAIA
jgi:branched-chain amino acid transport system permease protein